MKIEEYLYFSGDFTVSEVDRDIEEFPAVNGPFRCMNG